MREGYLSQYFTAVAAKRLSLVEADAKASNQHEFNGTKELQRVLGVPTGEKVPFSTKFMWFGEDSQSISSDGFVTWYDSRYNNPNRSPEYRLYFSTSDFREKANAGDLLLISRKSDDSLLVIIAAQGSTIENQLLWLFGLPSDTGKKYSVQTMSDGGDKSVDFVARFILEDLNIIVEEPQADYLDSLLQKFSGAFPTTRVFSQLVRDTLTNVSPIEEPDITLIRWMELEENLFRRLERHIVSQRLQSGFVSTDGTVDVDGFISFSLGVQNRRKSRAGLALENHLAALFNSHNITYSHTAVTENKAKPDFLFPGSDAYHSPTYPTALLTMLGVKTTCKDRWRQVLSEAEKIPDKHLLTLEPGISEHQTDEMQAQSLQLVLPAPIHETYRQSQRNWLMNLSDFIALVKDRDARSVTYRVPRLNL